MAPQLKILLLTISIVAMWTSNTSASLSSYCLQCICEQTPSCSCSKDRGCGPYNIEESFISPEVEMSYTDCKSDSACSRNVLQDYVDRYDLRESTRLMTKCEVASKLHIGGAQGPSSRAADTFWLLVQSCMTME